MFKNMGNSFLSKRKIFITLIIHYIFTKINTKTPNTKIPNKYKKKKIKY